MMEFFEPVARGVADYSEAGDEGAALRTEVDPEAAAVQPLDFAVDSEAAAAIDVAIEASLAKSASCGVETLEYTAFGKRFITGHQCSPDGFAQAAMMLTFYGMRRRLPVPYESVLAKAFRHGRVTVARNMSPEIAAQILAFHDAPDADAEGKVAAFRAIVADVGRICRDAASARDIDRPLLALQNLAKVHGLPMPSITEDPSWARMNDLDLCTSHCGKSPGIRFFGYEPAGADCFSIGYYVDGDRLQFSINHFDKAEAAAFKAALGATLDDLRSVLER